MGRCFGRAWAYAACLLSLDVLAEGPRTAFSQDGEEVIADPELAGNSKGPARNADGDETIADPELGGSGSGISSSSGFEDDYGWGSVYTPKTRSQGEAPPPEPEEDEYDPLANTGIGKLELLGQQVFDLKHDEKNLLEDFYETRLRFGGEVDFRVSRKLRLSLGTRIDFLWAAPHQDDKGLVVQEPDAMQDFSTDELSTHVVRYTPLEQDRYELDIIPLAAYADWTAAEGVHIRLGVQPTYMGRMDGFSVTDLLAVLDLRPGPTANPASLRLAQPAMRLDWDLSSWATLQAIYVPWFMQHLSRGTRDLYVQEALLGKGLTGTDAQSIELLDPSNQVRASEAALRLVAPAPDFRSPQVEARLNFRASSFEFALVGGTGLEKIPSVYYVPWVDQLLRGSRTDMSGAPIQDLSQLFFAAGLAAAQGSPVIDVAFHRYALVGFDGSFDIAPVQIGFEFAYSPERHFYASTPDGSSMPLPNVSQQICNPATATMPGTPGTPCENNIRGNVSKASIRKGVPVVMGALHLEWLKGETFMFMGEVYLIQTLEMPYDKSRDWLGAIEGTGLFAGGMLTAALQLDEGRWNLAATGLFAPGPSLILTPQIELRIMDGLYVNVGAQFYQGPAPVLRAGFAPTNLTLGGMYAGYDNAYVGFRWLP